MTSAIIRTQPVLLLLALLSTFFLSSNGYAESSAKTHNLKYIVNEFGTYIINEFGIETTKDTNMGTVVDPAKLLRHDINAEKGDAIQFMRVSTGMGKLKLFHEKSGQSTVVKLPDK